MLPFKIKGYVLLVVMVFLQILSCLGLYELTSLMSAIKVNYHEWLRESYMIRAKKMLKGIEQEDFANNSACVISLISADEITKKPLEWWQLKGCYRDYADFHGFFVIEFLGNDACAEIKKDIYNQPIVAFYYRITLFSYTDKPDHIKLILQSTLVKPSPEHLSCAEKTHIVLPGRQVMREL